VFTLAGAVIKLLFWVRVSITGWWWWWSSVIMLWSRCTNFHRI